MSAVAPEMASPPALDPAPPPPPQRPSLRSLAMGMALALGLCAINSYLTLSFGVIEEGPTIAALFFFATFYLSRTRIQSHEMVMVATMGSAGGSLGFISNFFAAKVMATGTSFTVAEMTAFGVTSSLVGLAFVVPLRELLIVRERLPWPGSKATASVIEALVEAGDPKQPRYLALSAFLAIAFVIANTDGGFGLVPDASAIPLFGLAAFSAAIAWSPFAIGGAYLMGVRTCIGFFFGGVILLALAPHLPVPAAPHRYVWPGIGFLVASGLMAMALQWRTLLEAAQSMMRFGQRPTGPVAAATPGDDGGPPIAGRAYILLLALAVASAVGLMGFAFAIPALIGVALVVVGGLIQNLIATRAAAQTAFNPARVMGILLQGVTALLGAPSAAQNLVGAGMVAGSGAQAGNLTGDLVYGRRFSVPSRWQFWGQAATIVPCALTSAWVFAQITGAKKLAIEGGDLPAPVAKMWAASAIIFDGSQPLPPFALQAMCIAGAVGAVYVFLEQETPLQKFLPSSLGLGLGLVLPVAYDWAFFVGGIALYALHRFAGVRELTLTTIAVGCIVGEGIGGIAKPILAIAGVL